MGPQFGNDKLKYMKQKTGVLLSGFLFLAITTWSQTQQDQNLKNQDSLVISSAAQEKFNEAIGAFETQDFASSITAFSEAIVLAPQFAKAYLNRGYAYLEMKNTSNAKADFLQVINIDKTAHQAFF
jgi:Tfp pilus assembly protein PilF